MLYIEERYLKMIGPRLKGFKEKGNHVYNFGCPLCGDSKKKNKHRGYCFSKIGKLFYSCHNCGASMLFRTFLKDQDPNLFSQYSLEMFRSKMNSTVTPQAKLPVATTKYIPNIFAGLTNVKDLDDDSEARVFCEKRKLPFEDFDFYYAPKFVEWTKGNSDKFLTWKGPDHARLIIPFRDRLSKIIGYTARAFGSEDPKYYRILIDDEAKERFFGLDALDEAKQVYVLEGEIDSLMIPNAVAVSNGKLQAYLNRAAIYIPDADVRNKHVMRNVKDMIALGLKVCMMPAGLPGKDLNELVQAGLTRSEILDIIKDNTYQGLSAHMKFTTWSNI